jgi:Na+/glutamate symporter
MKLFIVIGSVVLVILISLIMRYLGVIGNFPYFIMALFIGIVSGILLIISDSKR